LAAVAAAVGVLLVGTVETLVAVTAAVAVGAAGAGVSVEGVLADATGT
jgi:hypothetical protein